MVAYINAYKNLFGVEPICRVLQGPQRADRPEHVLRSQEATKHPLASNPMSVSWRSFIGCTARTLVCTASVRCGTPSSTRVSTLGVTRWRA